MLLNKCASIAGVLLFACCAASALAWSTEERLKAESYFAEFASFCLANDKVLWKQQMCGPTMLVNPITREALLNEAVLDASFSSEGKLFSGKLPAEVPIGNTATQWNDKRWTMLLWPLPADQRVRISLFAHESWHAIQSDLGLPTSGAANAHLDRESARVWLRLEWRALADALVAKDAAKRRAATMDALSFRRARWSEFANAAKEEADMEAHEGLAEYTGIALAYANGTPGREARARAATQLTELAKNATFTRSFAYGSGPAYGLLLDTVSTSWRNEISIKRDLSTLLTQKLQLSDLAVPPASLIKKYDGEAIRNEERERALKIERKIANINERFLTGNTLQLPLKNMRFNFNPQAVFNMPNGDQFHETITVRDDWGELKAHAGALIVNWQKMVVVAPASSDALDNANWQLMLAPGWRVVSIDNTFRLLPPT
jgi:hypothetical protein